MNNFLKYAQKHEASKFLEDRRLVVRLLCAVCCFTCRPGPSRSTFLPLSHLFSSPIAHLNRLRTKALLPTYESGSLKRVSRCHLT